MKEGNKDQIKEQIKALLIIFSAVLFAYKLPHDSYSISQYILRPIRINKATIFLSGLIPLILFIMGIRRHLKLERYQNRDKFMPVVFVLLIVLPLMKGSINFVRTQYYNISNRGLYSLDILDSNIHLNTDGPDRITKVNINLEIKGYDYRLNKFKIRVFLPKTLQEIVEVESFILDETFETFGGPRCVHHYQSSKTFKLDSEEMTNELFHSNWHQEEVTYELFNEKQSIKIIDHGY